MKYGKKLYGILYIITQARLVSYLDVCDFYFPRLGFNSTVTVYFMQKFSVFISLSMKKLLLPPHYTYSLLAPAIYANTEFRSECVFFRKRPLIRHNNCFGNILITPILPPHYPVGWTSVLKTDETKEECPTFTRAYIPYNLAVVRIFLKILNSDCA